MTTTTTTYPASGYMPPTVDPRTGAVWSQTPGDHGQLRRLVVDTRRPGEPFWLYAKAALRLNTERPMGRLHRKVCPHWRWATETDLDNWKD